jgi:hypothetical protein
MYAAPQRAALATRNLKDFQGTGIDPWQQT